MTPDRSHAAPAQEIQVFVPEVQAPPSWTVIARRWLPILLLLTCAFAYLPGLSGSFLFDDKRHIIDNYRIRSVFPLGTHLSARRPLVSLSLALNYAAGGLEPRGYKVTNVAIHLLAGLVLLALAELTLGRLPKEHATRPRRFALALLITALWMLHPLQTQSVTYAVQRAESLMGLFYLLTLYLVAKGAVSERARGWFVLAVVACALGMATKEVMVTAPLVVVLYDRTFLAGSFRKAFRERWGLHAALVATWLVLALSGVFGSVLGTTPESSPGTILATDAPPVPPPATVGFGTPNVTAIEYARTQPGVILHYIGLACWPKTLCFDYGWPVASWGQALLPGFVLLGALAFVGWCLVRRPTWGFVGAAFFLLLAPTSSIIPIRDLAVEHRMYLPLISVVVADLALLHATVGLFLRTPGARRTTRARWTVLLALAGLIACVHATYVRNADYLSPLTLWKDVAAKRPDHARGHYNLAHALNLEGFPDRALAPAQRARALAPGLFSGRLLEGAILARMGRLDEARAGFEQALAEDSMHPVVLSNLSAIALQQDRLDEAEALADRALKADPEAYLGWYTKALVRRRRGDVFGAIEACERALVAEPDFSKGAETLGFYHEFLGQIDEAIRWYSRNARVQPESGPAQTLLAVSLRMRRRFEESLLITRRATELSPGHAPAWWNLGEVLKTLQRYPEALEAFRQGHAVASQPSARWRAPSLSWVEDALRYVSLSERNLETQAFDPAREEAKDLVRWARIFGARGQRRTAVQCWHAAFAKDPAIPAEAHWDHRIQAAADALAAGFDPLTDPMIKAGRPQALTWLREELAFARSHVSDPSKTSDALFRLHALMWREDLTSIRSPDLLAELPREERAAWEAFWNDARAALNRR